MEEKALTIVMFEWLDAYGDSRWRDFDSTQVFGQYPVTTVGILIEEDTENAPKVDPALLCVMMATAPDEGKFFNYLCVPKGMILRMWELTPKRANDALRKKAGLRSRKPARKPDAGN